MSHHCRKNVELHKLGGGILCNLTVIIHFSLFIIHYSFAKLMNNEAASLMNNE